MSCFETLRWSLQTTWTLVLLRLSVIWQNKTPAPPQNTFEVFKAPCVSSVWALFIIRWVFICFQMLTGIVLWHNLATTQSFYYRAVCCCCFHGTLSLIVSLSVFAYNICTMSSEYKCVCVHGSHSVWEAALLFCSRGLVSLACQCFYCLCAVFFFYYYSCLASYMPLCYLCLQLVFWLLSYCFLSRITLSVSTALHLHLCTSPWVHRTDWQVTDLKIIEALSRSANCQNDAAPRTLCCLSVGTTIFFTLM